MGPLLLVLLIVVPLAELWIVEKVASGIGLGWTLALLLAVSIAGAWLLKREGISAWRRLRETMRRGRMPTKELVDGAMIIFGGALLLTPGFLTDGVGFLLVLPPTRATVKGLFRRAFARRAERWQRRRGVYTTSVVDVQRTPHEGRDEEQGSSSAPRASSPLPSGKRPAGEGGSPDTR